MDQWIECRNHENCGCHLETKGQRESGLCENCMKEHDTEADELTRLRAELADALDCKNGNGPTALSMVIDERDKIRADLAASQAECERLRADFSALQHALVGDTGASAILSVERLRADAERLDWLESEIDDLRAVGIGEDDYQWVVVSHHMAPPHERDVGSGRTARAAIDAARAGKGE